MKTLCLLVAVLFVSGCSVMPWRHRAARAVASFDKVGAPVVAQKGDVQEPAHASTETTVTTLPIPAGSVVTVSAPAATPEARSSAPPASITLAAATELRTETRKQSVEGAKSFTPPSPPSAVEIARAKGTLGFYIAGGICGLLAIFGFAMGFTRAAIWLAVGGLVMPTAAQFVSEHFAALVGVAAAAGAFAYWHAWHVMKPSAVVPSPSLNPQPLAA